MAINLELYHTFKLERVRYLSSLAFSSDGKILSSSDTEDGMLASSIGLKRLGLWDVENCQEYAIALEDDYRSTANCLRFAPNGNLLASGDYDGSIRLWDAATGKRIASTSSEHQSMIESIAFNDDGLRLASASLNNGIRVWSLSGEKFSTSAVLDGHDGQVFAVAFSLDGKLIASGGDDMTVRLWEAATYRQFAVLKTGNRTGLPHGVRSIAFSPNGKFLAVGTENGQIQFWDFVEQKMFEKLELDQSSNNWVNRLSFNPNGSILVARSSKGQLTLWSTTFSGLDRQLIELSEDESILSAEAAFSPKGNLLAFAVEKRGGSCEIRLYKYD
jgi:WD40 repeat protein